MILSNDNLWSSLWARKWTTSKQDKHSCPTIHFDSEFEDGYYNMNMYRTVVCWGPITKCSLVCFVYFLLMTNLAEILYVNGCLFLRSNSNTFEWKKKEMRKINQINVILNPVGKSTLFKCLGWGQTDSWSQAGALFNITGYTKTMTRRPMQIYREHMWIWYKKMGASS